MRLRLPLLACFCFALVSNSAFAQRHENLKYCMLKLPQSVVVSSDMQEMNFSKSQRLDSFWDFEQSKTGRGYLQSYQNGGCMAFVSVFQDRDLRISNTKVQRRLKDETKFPEHQQKNVRVASTKFFGISGKDSDIYNTLFLGAYHHHYLKVRLTCSIFPRMTEDEFDRLMDTTSIVFLESIVSELNHCLKK